VSKIWLASGSLLMENVDIPLVDGGVIEGNVNMSGSPLTVPFLNTTRNILMR
jgi:hypothetical protein